MPDAALAALPDTQAEHDGRGIAIDAVGIGGLRYPVTIAEKGGLAPVSTVGTFDMRVRLRFRCLPGLPLRRLTGAQTAQHTRVWPLAIIARPKLVKWTTYWAEDPK